MSLKTMDPNPVWVADAYGDTVDILSAHAEELVFKVWGGDWCKDCRAQLPDLGAALEAAGVPEDRIEQYPVEKTGDGSKVGPKVEEYDIELIPTVVVERAPGGPGGERHQEIARYVEDEGMPIAVYLGERIEDALATE